MTPSPRRTRLPPAWLRALGARDLPPAFTLGGRTYLYVRTFKHDFFAATGLYEGAGGKVVLKMGRVAPLFGIPAAWIGRFLTRREARLLHRARSVPGVPPLLGIRGRTGLVRAYIEGRPLGRRERPDDAFFPRLAAMLEAMHALDVAYVDLEKPENILRADDGRPCLIDFQIAWYVPANRLGDTGPARALLRVLQAADRYHLLKHWRRLRPDQMNAALLAESRRAPFWIAGHRLLFRPLIRLRRQVLVWLGSRSSAKGRSPG